MQERTRDCVDLLCRDREGAGRTPACKKPAEDAPCAWKEASRCQLRFAVGAHEHAPHDLVFVRPRKVPEQGPDRVGVHEDIGVQEDENLATRSRCEPVHARGEADVRVACVHTCAVALGDDPRSVDRVVVEAQDLSAGRKLAAKSRQAVCECGLVVPRNHEDGDRPLLEPELGGS